MVLIKGNADDMHERAYGRAGIYYGWSKVLRAVGTRYKGGKEKSSSALGIGAKDVTGDGDFRAFEFLDQE